MIFSAIFMLVEIGSFVGDWQVSWVGGWGRHRLAFWVRVVKLERPAPSPIAALAQSSCVDLNRR
jgi:hypothetical protein